MATLTSQISGSESVPAGTGSSALEPDRSKSPLWVPELAGYGGELPLLVGIDAEWKNLGQTNRVLSYQFFAFDFSGVDWRGIYYPRPDPSA